MPLLMEFGLALLQANRGGQWMDLVDALPQSLRNNWRIRLLDAQAALNQGRLKRVQAFLDQPMEITTLREGESNLTDLWFAFHEKRLAKEICGEVTDEIRRRVREENPPPRELDFRLYPERE
jgi:hypothetical protein